MDEDIKNKLIDKFTCGICYELHPLLMNFRCDCEKIYCTPCLNKWNKEICPYCKTGSKPKFINSCDSELANVLFNTNDKIYQCINNDCLFKSNNVNKHIEHYKLCNNKLCNNKHCNNKLCNNKLCNNKLCNKKINNYNEDINNDIMEEINSLLNNIQSTSNVVYPNRFYTFNYS
jgi:hypothetical protein